MIDSGLLKMRIVAYNKFSIVEIIFLDAILKVHLYVAPL